MDGAVVDLNLQDEMAYAVADALIERQGPFVFTTDYIAVCDPTPLRWHATVGEAK